LVWWFAPKCPLANVFGVDPFKIYPWDKLCKIYSDFETEEVCKPYVDNLPKRKREAPE
jgi:hypothetical protein